MAVGFGAVHPDSASEGGLIYIAKLLAPRRLLRTTSFEKPAIIRDGKRALANGACRLIGAVTRLRYRVEKGAVVADLTGGHEEAQRASVRIGKGMQFGVHASFGAIDQTAETSFSTCRLDAVRCAFK